MTSAQKTDAVKKLYDLWSADNNMLNTKLSQLFIVNSLLLAVVSLSLNGKTQSLIPITCLFGLAFSALSFFSLRRTLAFRAWYRKKITEFSGDETLPDLLPTPEDELKEFTPTHRLPSHIPGQALSIISCGAWFAGLIVSFAR